MSMLRPSRPSRRLAAIVMAGAFGLVAAPAIRAADGVDPTVSPNLLDHPWVDVAALEQTGPDGVSNLLVLEPLAPDSTIAHVSILERDGAWRQAASTTVDLASAGIDRFGQPWLVGLGGDRFAMLARSEPAAGTGRTEIVILVASDEAGRRVVQERERVQVAVDVDAAGAADVVADGVPDLVVTSSTGGGPAAACRGSTMSIFPDGRLQDPVERSYPDLWFGAGVLGGFDDVPGDDLALYAATACPANSTTPTLGLGAIRLRDGGVITHLPLPPDGSPRSLEPPVRLDIGGDGRSELMAHATSGLALVDPSHDWAELPLGSAIAFALAAAPVASPDGDIQTRVAWLEPGPDGGDSIVTEGIGRDVDGNLTADPSTIVSLPRDGDRWSVARAATTATADRSASPVGWTTGPTAACPDTYITSAVLACVTSDVTEGPAWIGTRPLLAFVVPDARRLLVAAGLDRELDLGVPATPGPWAGSAPGVWRHGPSRRFALAEVDVDDSTSQRPLGRPTIGPEAAAGPAATLSGRGGTRLVVGAVPVASDAAPPSQEPDLSSALTALASSTTVAGGGVSAVVRVPVPPDQPSGGDRSSASVSLADVRSTGGEGATRWDVTALPLSDLGELEDPLAASVTLDQVKPALTLAVPFTTPVWPFTANLTGRTEPGATVEVAGGARATVARDGSFTFTTTLAPWPQTIRVAAVDAVGNRTVSEVSVVGGVDYRSFPWPAIVAIAVLAGVIASGIAGTRRRRGPLAVPTAVVRWEDGPAPELEDLPPGSGL